LVRKSKTGKALVYYAEPRIEIEEIDRERLPDIVLMYKISDSGRCYPRPPKRVISAPGS